MTQSEAYRLLQSGEVVARSEGEHSLREIMAHANALSGPDVVSAVPQLSPPSALARRRPGVPDVRTYTTSGSIGSIAARRGTPGPVPSGRSRMTCAISAKIRATARNRTATWRKPSGR